MTRTQQDLTEAARETFGALADAQEQLAETSELEWLSRYLRAHATFTRSFGDASARLAHDLLAED